eukprot:TRINITY_DN24640_c0_g1_i1.p1 TRINITY_DN24640_c0_g1~~TRINITY_DN24640_c0_g1_i1.p1  ORF type:complete len:150 (+),score=24.07 TRINITY_DN24640_c0_g1_i1:150-599(+)
MVLVPESPVRRINGVWVFRGEAWVDWSSEESWPAEVRWPQEPRLPGSRTTTPLSNLSDSPMSPTTLLQAAREEHAAAAAHVQMRDYAAMQEETAWLSFATRGFTASCKCVSGLRAEASGASEGCEDRSAVRRSLPRLYERAVGLRGASR